MHTASHYQQSYIPTRHPESLIHLLYNKQERPSTPAHIPIPAIHRKKSTTTPSLSHHATESTIPPFDSSISSHSPQPLLFQPYRPPIQPPNNSYPSRLTAVNPPLNPPAAGAAGASAISVSCPAPFSHPSRLSPEYARRRPPPPTLPPPLPLPLPLPLPANSPSFSNAPSKYPAPWPWL